MEECSQVYSIISLSSQKQMLTVNPLKLDSSDILACSTPVPKTPLHESIKKEKRVPVNEDYIDTTQFVEILDKKVLLKAYATLPNALRIRNKVTTAKRPLPQFTKFGPVQGISNRISSHKATQLVKQHYEAKVPIFIIKHEDGSFTHLNVTDHDKSNWISLLPLGSKNTANVWVCQRNNNLYLVTTRSIPPGEPLMLGYTKEYAKTYNLNGELPFLDWDEELRNQIVRWSCQECSVSFQLGCDFQRHVKNYHMKKLSIPRYRCKHCAMTFTRLYSLKRHKITKKCPKLVNETKEIPTTSDAPTTTINTTSTTEDENRIPSDESLQNYTSMLDFSTNLFDSDRISNLDLSGARSENDFNLITGFDFDEAANKLDDPVKMEKKGNMKKTSSPNQYLTCTFCSQNIPKNKVRQHAKLCLKRRSHCQHCRKFFATKASLALHVYNVHREKDLPKHAKVQKKDSSGDIETYRCSLCDVVFKRRGMLVNHMMRVHEQAVCVAATVPLLVKDKRYPCPACPKLYSAAAKRDYHVSVHHPGIEYNRSRSIDLGHRVKQPASCWLCPRQYVTKAKLLQHVRQRHPGAGNSQNKSSRVKIVRRLLRIQN